jgi:hypothetical protein
VVRPFEGWRNAAKWKEAQRCSRRLDITDIREPVKG